MVRYVYIVKPVNEAITNKQCRVLTYLLFKYLKTFKLVCTKYIPVFNTRLFGFLFLPGSYSFCYLVRIDKWYWCRMFFFLCKYLFTVSIDFSFRCKVCIFLPKMLTWDESEGWIKYGLRYQQLVLQYWRLCGMYSPHTMHTQVNTALPWLPFTQL